MKKYIKRISVKNLNKKDCYICNRYGYITELHHLTTISDINKMFYLIEKYSEIDMKSFFENVNDIVSAIWLCPNHHRIYHKLLSKQDVQTALMISKEEKEKYSELFEHVKSLYEILIGNMRNDCLDIRIVKQSIKKKIEIEQTLAILQALQEK